MLLFLDTFITVLLLLSFLILLLCTSFTMTDFTSKKMKKVITLSTILETASFSDVVLEQVIYKVSHKASQVKGGKPLMTAKSVLRVDFQMLKVDQICMLCSMWKLKKYRSAVRDKLCILII
jgi:hypothetical protein